MNNFMNLPLAWWNITPFYEGMPASAKMSAIGFMFFGCGVEMAGITVSRGIVKWFKGKEMALAMGVEMAIARLGVAVVVLGSPVLATIQPVDVSRPVAVAVILLLIGLIAFIVYAFMDKKLEQQLGENDEEMIRSKLVTLERFSLLRCSGWLPCCVFCIILLFSRSRNMPLTCCSVTWALLQSRLVVSSSCSRLVQLPLLRC